MATIRQNLDQTLMLFFGHLACTPAFDFESMVGMRLEIGFSPSVESQEYYSIILKHHARHSCLGCQAGMGGLLTPGRSAPGPSAAAAPGNERSVGLSGADAQAKLPASPEPVKRPAFSEGPTARHVVIL